MTDPALAALRAKLSHLGIELEEADDRLRRALRSPRIARFGGALVGALSLPPILVGSLYCLAAELAAAWALMEAVTPWLE